MLDKMKKLLADEPENGYKSEWKAEAVEVLNEYYEEYQRYDDHIYEIDSDEWEDLMKWNIDQRGCVGVKIFLDGIDSHYDYAYLDGYGNGKSADNELKQLLEWAIDEIEQEHD